VWAEALGRQTRTGEIKYSEMKHFWITSVCVPWGRKEQVSGGDQPFCHFIHLLYTILRHKFKQHRIGKSLADQQCLYLLWGTRQYSWALPPPYFVHRPMWLYSSVVTPNTDQQHDMKMPKATQITVCWEERHTPQHSDIHTAGNELPEFG
jgi:hypothetical protein